jgi:hypothetical protein
MAGQLKIMNIRLAILSRKKYGTETGYAIS